MVFSVGLIFVAAAFVVLNSRETFAYLSYFDRVFAVFM
jgi:hypothetical protein